MGDPVSIRTKNPGAMWPCAIATQFGSVSYENLTDGNKAAIFPTFEQGAAAQFALWAKNYSGMTLQAAIYRWSGHNSSSEYATALARDVPGLSMSTTITRSFLAGPLGRQFMKAQAKWEAGRVYPMTDDQWSKAQELAFGAAKVPPPPDIEPIPPKVKKNSHATTGAAGAATGAALNILGLPIWACVSIAFVVALIVYLILKNRK
jgi:hypothetical protein